MNLDDMNKDNKQDKDWQDKAKEKYEDVTNRDKSPNQKDSDDMEHKPVE